MKTTPNSPSSDGPRSGDPVGLVDPSTGRPLRAVVEALQEDGLSVRFRAASRLRGRTRIRWFDGEQAWEVAAAVHAGADLDRAEVELLEAWAPVVARGSARVSVDRFPLLVEVIESPVNTKGRRFDLLCHDVSATGCSASAAGRAPSPGDLVRVAWVRGDEWTRVAPEWIDARVTRSETRPFGGGQVGLRFDPTDEVSAARVLAWRDAWALNGGSVREPAVPASAALPLEQPEVAAV